MDREETKYSRGRTRRKERGPAAIPWDHSPKEWNSVFEKDSSFHCEGARKWVLEKLWYALQLEDGL